MSTTISAGKSTKNAAFALLVLLAACGGGQGSAPQALSASPQWPEPTPLPPTPVGQGGAAPAPAEQDPPAILADAAQAPTESIVLAAAYTPLVQGTLYNTPYWPVWYGSGKPVDGVHCLINASYHQHALISIYKDGRRLGFPDGIGRVHAGCYHAYEMHVHDVTGILHMEADVPKRFKLGQWFSLWGQPLGRDNAAGLIGPVRYYVIDKEKIARWDSNPYDIEMLPHREVLIVSGTALSVVPRYKWPLGI